jgi:CheY-like chemotaxis protein
LPAADVILLITFLIVLVGWSDYATGRELRLFILYAAPIILAVWRFGVIAGILSASLSSIVWLFANEATHPYQTDLGYTWAMLSRLFYFGVVVFAVLEVRKKQEAAAALGDLAKDDDTLGLILCDHRLPGQSGVDFLAKIHQAESWRPARKVLLTGQADRQDTIRAINEGGLNHCLAKP